MLKNFSEYTEFKGRSTRSELWIIHVLIFVINLAVSAEIRYLLINHMDYLGSVIGTFMMMFPGNLGAYVIGGIVLFYMIGMWLPLIATNVRRLHDMNFSGWWLLGYYIFLIVVGVIVGISKGLAVHFPQLQALTEIYKISDSVSWGLSIGAGLIYFVFLFLIPGTKGSNKYGPDEREMAVYVRARKAELRAARKAEKKAKLVK